ncbi:MAG: hypothetical protein IJD58_10220 [Lachnospiraceae bacterium]|nr:hypothetical protein [Lachnospiraceae bacterium]
MGYELRKCLCNKTVILIILIFFVVNGLEASYKSLYPEKVYDTTTTETYKKLIDEAFENIDEGRDVYLSSIFIDRFYDRQITAFVYDEEQVGYETEEVAFVNYETSAMYGLILVAVIVIISIDLERKTRMTQIISVTEKRNGRIHLAKQLAIAAVVVFINAFLFIENVIVHKLVGEIDYGMKLYNIPGYRATLFNGSILEYKIICAIGVCVIEIIIANIIYILACFLKRNIHLIIGSVCTYVVLKMISDNIAFKNYPYSLFSFFKSKNLVKEFIVVRIGNGYTYYLWIALVFLFVVMLITNVCNYFMNKTRRSI